VLRPGNTAMQLLETHIAHRGSWCATPSPGAPLWPLHCLRVVCISQLCGPPPLPRLPRSHASVCCRCVHLCTTPGPHQAPCGSPCPPPSPPTRTPAISTWGHSSSSQSRLGCAAAPASSSPSASRLPVRVYVWVYGCMGVYMGA
jgi:hypothetical protein